MLQSKAVELLAVEAVAWAETNRQTWRALCRDFILTAIKLDALRQSASDLIATCPDTTAVSGESIPLAQAIDDLPLSDWYVRDLTEQALSAEIVSAADLKKAKT